MRLSRKFLMKNGFKQLIMRIFHLDVTDAMSMDTFLGIALSAKKRIRAKLPL